MTNEELHKRSLAWLEMNLDSWEHEQGALVEKVREAIRYIQAVLASSERKCEGVTEHDIQQLMRNVFLNNAKDSSDSANLSRMYYALKSAGALNIKGE